MRLNQIMKEVPAITVEGTLDREVEGVAYDFRRVSPGMVFVALPGGRDDEAICGALERGATAVICQRNGAIPRRTTKIVVRDCREALAQTAAAFHSHPSRKLRVIAVTGSEHRATVAFMLKRVLEQAGVRAGLISSVNCQVADRLLPVQRSRPEALEVQQLLAQMVRAGCQVCVLEVGDEPADAELFQGVACDVVISVRLANHQTGTAAAICVPAAPEDQVVRTLCSSGKHGVVVLHVDGSTGGQPGARAGVQVRITGQGLPALNLQTSIVDLNRRGTRVVMEASSQRIACTLPLWGKTNVWSAVATTGVALALGMRPAEVRPALQRLASAPGCLEPVSLRQPFSVFVDAARDEGSLLRALGSLRDMSPGRVLVALGHPGGGSPEARFALGRAAATAADYTLITSDSPRQEPASGIAEQILRGHASVRADGRAVELDRARAIGRLLRLAQPGDAVLIAGKGHQAYQEFADTVVPFDDAGQARGILEDLGYGKGNGYELRVASHEQFRAWNAELASCNQ